MGVIGGLDPKIPVTLLPVRIETRFDGRPGAPKLLIRLYPDDIHVDHHDPRLTKAEVESGKRYWESVDRGTSEEQAWKQLVKDIGPRRATWVREALSPSGSGASLAFPDVETVDGNAGIAAAARALPDHFIVRVRHPGGEQMVRGETVPESLQVGISFGDAVEGDVPVPASTDPEASLVLDEPMRWMVDFNEAKAAGMAVEIDLPAGTNFIHDVTVVGVRTSDADASATLGSLIEAHRLSDGAAFIPPGTPTNNLADSESGYSADDEPLPAARVAADEGSVAAVLAEAWSLDPALLTPIRGAGGKELAEATQMGRALFEATWGSYLRQQGQPGFDLSLLPEVYGHVTGFVRGGGPLPCVRFGRQPYGIVPVMAKGDWTSLSEGRFLTWLAGFLPRIRRLWTSGQTSAPAGPELFAQEPVSTRVRLRTTNMGSVVEYMIGSGNALVNGSPEVSRRAMFAEIGFGDVMPSVFTQVFPKSAANLWLPMTADGDTEFDILAPAPKDANSVLGLLLRNSALRIAANATNEFAGLEAEVMATEVGRAAMVMPIANFPSAAGLAVPVLEGFAAEATVTTPAVLAAAAGRDTSGDRFTIGERIADIVADPARFVPDLTRYFNSDALAAFRDALAPLSSITTSRRAVLAGEIIDCASHRYDAWVTSLAAARLKAMRKVKQGVQLGAWGTVSRIERRELESVASAGILPEGTETDGESGGFVIAPSPRQASSAGVLRAAWLAHGGRTDGALAPFATGLSSKAVRDALTIAEGMRNGQPLGALLGYLLERAIHDASGTGGIEIDWVVFELRRQYPLKVDTIDNAPQASAERLVVDGWKLAQAERETPGSVVAAIVVPPPPPPQPRFGTPEKSAVQKAVLDLLATLDSFADLGLAESMYQLAGANYERAAAASDMMGRAAPPPDSFDSMTTPRGGRGIEQRLIISLGGAVRPAGFASDTPRARLAPAADAFVASKLGPITGLKVRLLDKSGTEVAAPKLSALGLSALDLAALDLSLETIQLNSITSPSTMPSAPNSNPGRQGIARLLLAAGVAEAVNIGFDLDQDADLIDLLDHAAAWQRTLAAKKPLSEVTFAARASLDAPEQFGALNARVEELAGDLANPAADLVVWGIGGMDAEEARASAAARIAAAAALGDPIEKAAALMGGPAIVEGTLGAPPADLQTCIGSQEKLLGRPKGTLARWIQDSARVRPAAAALAGALLRGDLAGAEAPDIWAAQSPATPYDEGVDPALAMSWAGLAHPHALGPAPVVCALIVGDEPGGTVTGIELDGWTEIVPSPTGTAAIAANLSAPDARAPNLILMAVPPDAEKPWTEEALLSVVDEALELADCRMVDLDSTKRVPALLPACYLAEFDEDDLGLRHFINAAQFFPTRWVAKGGA